MPAISHLRSVARLVPILMKNRPFSFLTTLLTLSIPPALLAQSPGFRGADFAERPGRLIGWGETGNAANPVKVADTLPSGRKAEGFIQVSGIGGAWAALHEDGDILFHGLPEPNSREIKDRIVKIAVTHGVLIAIDAAGRGYSWEKEDVFDVRPGEPLENLADIAAGNGQAYALTREGRLIWWGSSRFIFPEFAETIAPFQGSIVAISSRGYGGALVTSDGRALRWANFDALKPQSEVIENFVPDPCGIVSSGDRFSYPTPDGTWKLIGVLPLPQGTRAEVVLHSAYSLSAARDAAGAWSIHDDGKFPTIEGLREFVTATRPAALHILGYHADWEKPEKRTLGVIAIVPTGIDALTQNAPPESAPSAKMPTSTVNKVPADHGVTEARFLALLKVYEAQRRAEVDAPRDAAVQELSTKLDAALEREELAAIDAGNLDLVTAILAERKALKEGGYPSAGEGVSPGLDRLSSVWIAEKAKVDAEGVEADTELRAVLDLKLEELIRDLTQKRKIDEAVKIRAFREQLFPQTPTEP